jgi:hypothetical protein
MMSDFAGTAHRSNHDTLCNAAPAVDARHASIQAHRFEAQWGVLYREGSAVPNRSSSWCIMTGVQPISIASRNKKTAFFLYIKDSNGCLLIVTILMGNSG